MSRLPTPFVGLVCGDREGEHAYRGRRTIAVRFRLVAADGGQSDAKTPAAASGA
jgi:hypothetical protein